MTIVESLRSESGFTGDQVAGYLGISLEEYLEYEGREKDIPIDILEALARLYHVEEYDILTGTARSKTLCEDPEHEKELIPFFVIVQNYMKMQRLLEEANNQK